MPDETSPITVTLKGGGGYDAPWLVIRGNDPATVANMLNNLGDLPSVIAAQAALFTGTVTAGPALPGGAPQQAPQEQAPPQAAWGTINPQQGGFVPAQQGQQWAQPPQQQVTNGPPAQQQGSPGATLHPEGKQCPMDGKPLEYKRTQNGKGKWQCPDWRWQNGNPNGHEMIWAQ